MIKLLTLFFFSFSLIVLIILASLVNCINSPLSQTMVWDCGWSSGGNSQGQNNKKTEVTKIDVLKSKPHI